mmetsp:Transcript_72526/g.172938  ORF Transcript_72526/g.172938 Transcript_72526/m.172938 type:complete len:225 (+) Transcript_72526:1473-2147(+)
MAAQVHTHLEDGLPIPRAQVHLLAPIVHVSEKHSAPNQQPTISVDWPAKHSGSTLRCVEIQRQRHCSRCIALCWLYNRLLVGVELLALPIAGGRHWRHSTILRQVAWIQCSTPHIDAEVEAASDIASGRLRLSNVQGVRTRWNLDLQRVSHAALLANPKSLRDLQANANQIQWQGGARLNVQNGGNGHFDRCLCENTFLGDIGLVQSDAGWTNLPASRLWFLGE